MTDIEASMRAAMHAAVDHEVADSRELIRQVQRRQRQRSARLAAVIVFAASAVAIPSIIGSLGATSSNNTPPTTHPSKGPQKPLPSIMSGLPSPAATHLRLLISTPNGVGWYSTITKQTRRIVGVPPLAGGYSFRRMVGGWTASAASSGSACANPGQDCAGPPQEQYFIADGALRATRIGAGWSNDPVAPSTVAGEFWLISYPRPNDNSQTTPAYTQLVNTAGRPLGPRYRLPVAYWPARGVGQYVLLFNGPPEPVLLWDPRTRQVVRRFANFIDAGPDDIAFSGWCHTCRVQILNLSTGLSVTTPILGADLSYQNGTFSEDGTLLAVQRSGGPVAVYNTVTGKLTVIPGTALSQADWQNLGWQGAGHRLVLSAGSNNSTASCQVAYWQPGDRLLRVGTVRNAAECLNLQYGTVG